MNQATFRYPIDRRSPSPSGTRLQIRKEFADVGIGKGDATVCATVLNANDASRLVEDPFAGEHDLIDVPLAFVGHLGRRTQSSLRRRPVPGLFRSRRPRPGRLRHPLAVCRTPC
jgi:hypothetical protein